MSRDIGLYVSSRIARASRHQGRSGFQKSVARALATGALSRRQAKARLGGHLSFNGPAKRRNGQTWRHRDARGRFA